MLSSSSVILFGCGSGLDVFQIPPHRQALSVTGDILITLLKRISYIRISFALSILLFELLIGCFRSGDELTKFKKFEISYRDPLKSKYFALLFTQGDTIFLKKYSFGRPDTLFYSILPSSQRLNIDIFVKETGSLAINSIEDVNPGEERYSLYLDYVNERHSLYIHSLNPPKVFSEFNNWINKIMNTFNFIFIDTTVKFKGDETIHDAIQKNSH